MRCHRFLIPACAVSVALAVEAGGAQLTAEDVSQVRGLLENVAQAVSDEYHPTSRIDKAYRQQVAEAARLLGQAKSHNDANAIIADMLVAFDPRIRFYPPARSVRVDYGWDWRIIGDAAYVTHVDLDGDARAQGLKLGDKITSIEGAPLNRETSQQLYYAMYTLAPRPGLRVQVESPGAEPRWLAIKSTMRPPRPTRTVTQGGLNYVERIPTKLEYQRLQEFRDIKNHLHRTGPVLVWRAAELSREISSVSTGLKSVREAGALILDLRGQYVLRHETVLRLLDGLFSDAFEIGLIDMPGRTKRLHVSGGTDAFSGTVLVLVDSETANYAELAARVIQQKRRGVIIGDHTMGRAFEHLGVGYARGVTYNFNVSVVTVPVGEIRLADGYVLDGHGVAPDMRLLPKPVDLAGQRDIVLVKALAMLKQTVSPEDAYQFFRTDPDDDETD